MDASNPIFIERDGHRTWLKWHRARRRSSDPAFTGQRILEGMRLGASVEVDLVVHGDRGFAVLHDLTADRETTGRGRIAELSAAALRGFYLRGQDGTPLSEHVMLLEDLCVLLAQGDLHPDALLQLDYKEDWRVLDEAALAVFRQAVGPVAKHMILSSGDAEAVRILTKDVPGLRMRSTVERWLKLSAVNNRIAPIRRNSPRRQGDTLTSPEQVRVGHHRLDPR